MPWFSVRILLESKHKGQKRKKKPFYMESIFIIKGRNESTAYKRCLKYVKKHEEISYENVRGITVSWKIKKVLDVQEIFDKEPKDFTEVYSCFYLGSYPKIFFPRKDTS